jgi:hypothetical protein
MVHQKLTYALTAIWVITLAACSSGIGDKSKALKTINEGLAKSPTCQEVSVDVYYDEASLSSIALPALLEKGYIEAGQVYEISVWDRRKIPHAGYRFTEKGRALITKPVVPNDRKSRPCVAMGHWMATSIEALDEGTDMTGKTVVNARARIQFVPQDWVEIRRNDPAWESVFAQISKQESRQWMYQLLKSGDSLFYQGSGKPVD